MRKTTICRMLGVGYWIFFSLAFHCLASSWPQLQCTPDRKGYTPDTVAQPYAGAWYRSFLPERVRPTVQPIVSDGRLFVGTMNGRVHAFDARTGAVIWTAEAPGEILHTLGCAGSLVVAPCMDGSVQAFSADTGKEAWRFQAGIGMGFSTAPCIMDGRIYIGNRAGVFYALDAGTGEKIWEYETPAPIFQTAAGADGKIYFGDESIRMHCLDATSGKRLWISGQMNGRTLTEYWPVVHKSRVIVRPAEWGFPHRISIYNHEEMDLARRPEGVETHEYYPGKPLLDRQLYGNYAAYDAYGWLKNRPGRKPSPGDLEIQDLIMRLSGGEMPEEIIAAQREYSSYVERHPKTRRFFVFNAETGELDPPFPDFHAQSNNCNIPPPASTESGMLVIPWLYPNPCWALLDLDSRLATRVMPKWTGGNPDETAAVSVGGGRVFSFHSYHSSGTGLTGIFDIETGRWYQPGIGRMTREAFAKHGNCHQNCMGGGAHAASIANGMFYHIIHDTLFAGKSSAGADQSEDQP